MFSTLVLMKHVVDFSSNVHAALSFKINHKLGVCLGSAETAKLGAQAKDEPCPLRVGQDDKHPLLLACELINIQYTCQVSLNSKETRKI